MVVVLRCGEVLMGGCGTQLWWGSDEWLLPSCMVRY